MGQLNLNFADLLSFIPGTQSSQVRKQGLATQQAQLQAQQQQAQQLSAVMQAAQADPQLNMALQAALGQFLGNEQTRAQTGLLGKQAGLVGEQTEGARYDRQRQQAEDSFFAANGRPTLQAFAADEGADQQKRMLGQNENQMYAQLLPWLSMPPEQMTPAQRQILQRLGLGGPAGPDAGDAAFKQVTGRRGEATPSAERPSTVPFFKQLFGSIPARQDVGQYGFPSQRGTAPSQVAQTPQTPPTAAAPRTAGVGGALSEFLAKGAYNPATGADALGVFNEAGGAMAPLWLYLSKLNAGQPPNMFGLPKTGPNTTLVPPQVNLDTVAGPTVPPDALLRGATNPPLQGLVPMNPDRLKQALEIIQFLQSQQ